MVPIGTLEVKCQMTILRMEKNSVYSAFMSRSFGDTPKARMDAEEVSIADISRATGVSSDIVKKLRSREGSTTNVEDAAKLAAYFGQSVEDFMSDSPARAGLKAKIDLLTPGEQRIVLAQIEGILASRAAR